MLFKWNCLFKIIAGMKVSFQKGKLSLSITKSTRWGAQIAWKWISNWFANVANNLDHWDVMKIYWTDGLGKEVIFTTNFNNTEILLL